MAAKLDLLTRMKDLFAESCSFPFNCSTLVGPVVINSCNGIVSQNMSGAKVNLIKVEDGLPIEGVPLMAGGCGLFTFLHDIFIRNKVKDFSDEKRMAVECFTSYFNDDHHSTCLKKMKEKGSEITVAEVQAYLACHLFAPLLPTSKYWLDHKHFPAKMKRECPSCRIKLNFGNTSLGHPSVWYGYTDILIEGHKSAAVKVFAGRKCERSEKGDPGESATEDEEPSNKKRRLQVDKAGTPGSSSSGTDSSDEEGEFVSAEVNLSALKSGKMNAFSQAIAQTIVNAFCEVKRNPRLRNSFIPSFLATEKEVTLLMYCVGNDKLVISDALNIFDDKGGIDKTTVLVLWISFNYSTFHQNIGDDNFPNSRFQELVSKCGQMYVYDNEVSRPLVMFQESNWDFKFKLSDKFLNKYFP